MNTVLAIFGIISAALGSFLLLFMTPFTLFSGYSTPGLAYGVAGLLLIMTAYRLGIYRIIVALGMVLSLGGLVFIYLLTLAGWQILPREALAASNSVTTIEDAVEACRNSGLEGWDLVEYAQRLTARKFAYSRRNPWDSPDEAFARGLGYCQQQALALREILKHLEIESQLVYAKRCKLPPDEADGIELPERIGWHSWLEVFHEGELKDVCPGHRSNRPGSIHFEIISGVRPLHPLLHPFTHLRSVWDNLREDIEARRQNIE